MIRKTNFSATNPHVFLSLKIFKPLNKREERPKNVGKIGVVFSHIFCETLGALVRLVGITKA